MKNLIKNNYYGIITVTTIITLIISGITMSLWFFRPELTVMGTILKYWILESLIIVGLIILNMEHLKKLDIKLYAAILVVYVVGTVCWLFIWPITRISYKNFIHLLFFER